VNARRCVASHRSTGCGGIRWGGLLRIIGRVLGVWAGAALSNADALTRRWMGIALMPQAGVALGMALVAAQRFPDLSDIILPVVIGATVLFEVIGPVLTRRVLILGGEVPNPSSQP